MTAAEAIRPREEPRLLTVADYTELGETPSGYAELTEGRVEYVPSPLIDHNVACAEIRDQIKAQLPQELICVLDIDVDLQLVPDNQPGFCRRPDLVVIERDALTRQRREGGLVRARDVRIIMEAISPGSRRTDTVVKRAEYADAGIPHYWILDLTEPVSLLALHLAGALGYGVTGEFAGRVVISEPFPFTINLDTLV